MLRDIIAPALRQYGYKGSAPTWRYVNEAGDVAVINVQSSPYSSSGRLKCAVNLAVAPAPWLDWMRHSLGAAAPKAVSESLGLFRQRLVPAAVTSGSDWWWEITSIRSAEDFAAEMVEALEAVALPLIDRWLDRGERMELLQQGDLGFMQRDPLGPYLARARAVLLASEGPSPELDALVEIGNSNKHWPETSARAFTSWIRSHSGVGE